MSEAVIKITVSDDEMITISIEGEGVALQLAEALMSEEDDDELPHLC